MFNCYGQLSCYGSFRLNVDLDDSDIDVVAIVPDSICKYNTIDFYRQFESFLK